MSVLSQGKKKSQSGSGSSGKGPPSEFWIGQVDGAYKGTKNTPSASKHHAAHLAVLLPKLSFHNLSSVLEVCGTAHSARTKLGIASHGHVAPFCQAARRPTRLHAPGNGSRRSPRVNEADSLEGGDHAAVQRPIQCEASWSSLTS